jgi:hypothetical protein
VPLGTPLPLLVFQTLPVYQPVVALTLFVLSMLVPARLVAGIKSRLRARPTELTDMKGRI